MVYTSHSVQYTTIPNKIPILFIIILGEIERGKINSGLKIPEAVNCFINAF